MLLAILLLGKQRFTTGITFLSHTGDDTPGTHTRYICTLVNVWAAGHSLFASLSIYLSVESDNVRDRYIYAYVLMHTLCMLKTFGQCTQASFLPSFLPYIHDILACFLVENVKFLGKIFVKSARVQICLYFFFIPQKNMVHLISIVVVFWTFVREDKPQATRVQTLNFFFSNMFRPWDRKWFIGPLLYLHNVIKSYSQLLLVIIILTIKEGPNSFNILWIEIRMTKERASWAYTIDSNWDEGLIVFISKTIWHKFNSI